MFLESKCPVCKSSRIRRGYRPTPIWSKLMLRFNLLCDNCNWEFAGFALPWKIPSKTVRGSKNRKSISEVTQEKEIQNSSFSLAEEAASGKEMFSLAEEAALSRETFAAAKPVRKRIKKRIKTKV